MPALRQLINHMGTSKEATSAEALREHILANLSPALHHEIRQLSKYPRFKVKPRRA